MGLMRRSSNISALRGHRPGAEIGLVLSFGRTAGRDTERTRSDLTT